MAHVRVIAPAGPDFDSTLSLLSKMPAMDQGPAVEGRGVAADVVSVLLKTLCQCTDKELEDEYPNDEAALSRLSSIIAHASQAYNIHKSRTLTGAPRARAEAILKLANKALKLQNASWPIVWKGGVDAPIVDKSAVDNMEVGI